MSIRRNCCFIVVTTLLSSHVGSTEEGLAKLPTADTLIESIATTWDPIKVRLVANMRITQPGRPESESTLLIRRAGSRRTRIDFLSPEKDRGKAMIQSENETWLYIPRADRVVEIPAKRSPLAAGVLFEDLFPRHRVDQEFAVVEAGEREFVLVTDTDRIFFDPSNLLPVRRELYASSGRLLRTVQIEEMRDWENTQIPWKIHLVDHLRRGADVRLEVLEATTLTAEDEQLISRDRLSEAPVGVTADSP